MRKFSTALVTAAIAIGTAGFATIGQAEHSVDIEVGVAPPPVRVETAPEPRDGYIYDRGHYDWDGNRYVWVDGRFIEKREGHEWHPSVIEQRGEHWRFRGGHWDND